MMSFLDDLSTVDVAMLLDFVDSASSVSEAAESSAASDSSGEAQAPPLQVAGSQLGRRPNHGNEYRLRVRREIASLREEAASLEQQLALLKCDSKNANDAMAAWSVWKRMAIRQKTAKKQAQQENARLKASLERHLKTARALKRLLQKQMREQDDRFQSALSREAFHSDFWVIFSENLASSCFRIDAILQEGDLLNRTADFQDLRSFPRNGSWPAGVDIRHARVFPFDYQTISDSVWRPSSVMPLSNAVYETLTWSDDLIVVRSETPTLLGRVDVVVYAQLVLRRFRELTRTIHCYEMRYMVRSDHEAYDNIRIEGRGWYTIEDLVASFSTESLDKPPASIVLCWERSTIQGPAPKEKSLLRDIIAHQYDCHFNSVEDILMDEVVERRM